MIAIMKVIILLICAVAAIVLSSREQHRAMTCNLLSFFVAVGVTAFFPEGKMLLSLIVSAIVFALLFVLTKLVSRQAASHKKDSKKKTV